MPDRPGSAPRPPLPSRDPPQILLAHGGGGRLTRWLIDEILRPAFANDLLDALHDGAVADVPEGRIAFTTDSYVIRPLVFPGGDIGSLAVNGTVNDLAMCGARPLYLSCGLILEEGLPTETLRRVVHSMRVAADASGVKIVTGDTKVVDRGKGDGIYVNTAGIGIVEDGREIGPRGVRPGDAVLISGDIGRHGMAVMALREGLSFETEIESDCAPVVCVVLDLLAERADVHCLRDLTRGGLGAAVIEIAETAGVEIEIDEGSIPVPDGVRGACEILGIDPLYVACEGRFVAFVSSADAGRALDVLRRHDPVARSIGRVAAADTGRVLLRGPIGTRRIADLPSGEQLPRIC